MVREQWGTEQGRERLNLANELWKQVQADHPEYGRAQTALAVAQLLRNNGRPGIRVDAFR